VQEWPFLEPRLLKRSINNLNFPKWLLGTDGWWGDAGNLGISSKHADQLAAILTCVQECVNLNHGPSLHKFTD